MIEIRITIEQKPDGQMSVSHSTPSGHATLMERFVYESLTHAVNVMLELQGGKVVEVPVTKEMKVDTARN